MLTAHSPKFVQRAVMDGIQRSLERDLAAHVGLDDGPAGVRALVDVTRSLLRSRNKTPLQKPMAASLFCSALWTRQRADEAGYELDSTLCPLCLHAADTLWHRLYECASP